ncbi:MAG: DEAD/DEAH box helicase family protein [Gammaproteobacteria bacterium]|nr:DEAD/DEAH box helicase family protein [Gammaproteobacteria bacterium]
MGTSNRESILRKITEVEEHITHLATQQKTAQATLQSLRKRLTKNDEKNAQTSSICPALPSSTLTPKDKIALFLRLFRGRDDVYPKLWQNEKTSKKGYSPACANEWARGVCKKPRVKCGKCPNQAFQPVTTDTVLDHLQGRHVVGVYPILKDETCWFLAVDFDKEAWREDVMAFTETCRRIGVPYAIERSRSGDGAHVWFFFSSPVPAATARKMGSYLITETMARRHQLSMASYDRLFPNQDTLPNGGFGNLIALPLQYHTRQKGNTVFLDGSFEPFPDQWGFLASLVPIPADKIERIVLEATTRGQVIGLQIADTGGDEVDTSPWLRTPSRKPKHIPITEPIPRQVRGILAQRLYVDKADIPSPWLNQIKRLAAFQNPEFYKKQNLRLSTALTPRVISCTEEHEKHISLPRGCLNEVRTLFHEQQSHFEVEDLRNSGEPIDVRFLGELTDAQHQAAKIILEHDNGVVVAPPGCGKTVLGTYLIAQRKCSTLILVHRQPLLEQWKSQLGIFLDRDSKSIGQLGAGKRRLTGQVDVAMIQSLSRKETVDDIVAEYGQVIIDECHHLPAVSFERVLSEVKARYIVGLTATPQRRDGHQPIIYMQIGPVRFKADPRSQLAQRPFDHRLVVRETGFDPSVQAPDITIQKLYSLLVADEKRNEQIIDDVLLALKEGRSPILLTERKDHLEQLHERLKGFVRHIVVLRGGRSAKERREIQDQLASIPIDEERLLLATGVFQESCRLKFKIMPPCFPQFLSFAFPD